MCVCVTGGATRSWRWLVARMMRVLLRWSRLCCGGGGRGPLGRRLRLLWSYWRVVLKSLYFNSLCNSDSMLDAVFEPIYWLVDNLTRWFGVVSAGNQAPNGLHFPEYTY